MTEKVYRPRLSIELTEEQATKLRNYIPWGLKNALFQVFVDDVIEMIERHGQVFIAALLERKVGIGKVAKFEAKDDDHR